MIGSRILMLLVMAGAGWAGDLESDYHISSDPARFLYASSYFAHGQRHGYEDGFHQADLDIHMGRNAIDFRRAKLSIRGYRGEFGGRESFSRGYQVGYLRGYQDSWADRQFNPLPIAQLLEVTSLLLLPKQGALDFDRGFQAGYLSVAGMTSNTERTCSAAGESAYCSGVEWGGRLARATVTTATGPVTATGGQR